MLGYHVFKEGGYAASLGAAQARIGEPSCAQIFAAGPRNSKQTIQQSEFAAIRALNMNLVIHGAYIDTPWKPENTVNALRNMSAEMVTGDAIGAKGLVVHLSASAKPANVRNVVNGINAFPAETRSQTVFLEINAAKSSANTFETPEKLAVLFDAVRSAQPLHTYGLCVDTAHLWACGKTMASYDDAATFLDGLNAIGAHPVMFHLNDSKTALGSGKDHHEFLLKGNIWNTYGLPNRPVNISGIKAIVEYAERNNSMVVLERNEGTFADIAADLAILRALRAL